MVRTIALPTTTPLVRAATTAASAGSRMPNPTATGLCIDASSSAARPAAVSRSLALEPVTPVIDT